MDINIVGENDNNVVLTWGNHICVVRIRCISGHIRLLCARTLPSSPPSPLYRAKLME